MKDAKLRSDTRRTRNRLLDAAGRLSEERGLNFSLPDVAREAGVSSATAYRHFDALQELRREFYDRLVSHLVDELAQLLELHAGFRLFEAVCTNIVDHYEKWARPASVVRSPRGYLERLNEDMPGIVEHYQLLDRVLTNMIELGLVPEQDHANAILLWVTLFDERLYLDFRFGRGLTRDQTRAAMMAAVLTILRSPTRPG